MGKIAQIILNTFHSNPFELFYFKYCKNMLLTFLKNNIKEEKKVLMLKIFITSSPMINVYKKKKLNLSLVSLHNSGSLKVPI